MKLLITLIGLVLILEGLPYMAFPESMQDWLRQLSEMKPRSLRVVGALAVIAGLLICFVTQQTDLIP